MHRIKVYHFVNGGGGGVSSVVKNLLQLSKNRGIEYHVIYTINKETYQAFEFQKLDGALSQQVFYYSPRSNFYYTCKELAKLLPGSGVVAAHDWLELGMVSNLGLQNPVVHFIHGNYEYYYNLAKKHERSTDKFIAISPVIFKKFSVFVPERKTDIEYCRFPVPSIKSGVKENKVLKMIYCVRRLDDENKQFKLLPLINARLKAKQVGVEWTIIGEGMIKEELENVMGQYSGISLFSSLTNEDVIKLLPAQDVFVLPSLQEGFPVAVVEAMKAGAVPLITNWDGATEELVIHGKTGFYFQTGDVEGYASTIELLNEDRKLLNKLAADGVKKANELFDPFVNTEKIEEVITNAYNSEKRFKKPFKSYGSRLDKTWMPNLLTEAIRTGRKTKQHKD